MKILLSYLKIRLALNFIQDMRYLFCQIDGTLANKHWFLKKLNELFPNNHLAGYGFKVGGTTELILRGLPLHIVQMTGR